jgi:anthranilate phosphoribosyltransferase
MSELVERLIHEADKFSAEIRPTAAHLLRRAAKEIASANVRLQRVRAETIEECAKVADAMRDDHRYDSDDSDTVWRWCVEDLAAAIRALAEGSAE